MCILIFFSFFFQLLLALLLAGAGLHISKGTELQEKESDVKYKGPVVYTNLPPPVLYFPNFPERHKISNRGSSGDTEDKRVEYVPFPYKDLPLLVYQSESQPPVHVVEKSPSKHSDKEDSLPPQRNSGYQTGPAVYSASDSDQYGNQEAGSMHRPQAIIASPSEKYINVGLSTSPLTSIDTQNQQYISIGLTSLQSQDNDLRGQPSHLQQDNNYNQMQYSASQNIDNADYLSHSGEHLGESEPAYMYYPDQYSNQNADSQTQVPVEQITQAIQNYLLQQNSIQQASSGIHQAHISYPGKQDPYASSSERVPTQHVGITIIQQPSGSDAPEHAENGPQYAHPPPSNVRHPPPQNEQSYGDNQQQFVSIGVYPSTGNDYGGDPQQYYNLISPTSNDQYQNIEDDYRQPIQNYDSPPPVQNENTHTTGYQLISIDLSALKNQNGDQQRNNIPEYREPPPRPVNNPPPPPPPQNYRPTNENDNSYNNREKEVQQIFIQIPHNILSDQSEKSRGRGPFETPYTGTAQVGTVVRDPNKGPNGHTTNTRPQYNRPPPPRPPPIHHSERPRNPPKSVLSNGINIAIIKQTDSTNTAPVFKPSDQRPPHHHHTQLRTPTHPVMHRVPPPPNFQHPPRKPMFGFPSRPSASNNIRFNQGRDPRNFERNPYAAPPPRYANGPRHFGQYSNKPLVPQMGGHPGVFASSNQHYTATTPGVERPALYRNAFRVHPPITVTHTSATKNHAQFLPNPMTRPMSSNAIATSAESPFINNVSNGFGEINFDEINAFLNPNYDLFGSMTSGPDKKKVEEETKFLQQVAGDLLSHDMNTPNLAGTPPFGIMKPPPNTMNAPFPYKFWEQPFIPSMPPPPPGVMQSDRTKVMNFYSHMQHPYATGNRPFGSFGKSKGRKRGLRKGKLRNKLAALRTSIRHKTKIAPRQEVVDDGSEATSEQIDEAGMYEIAAPRSTIIKRDGPGLDGITIPLNPGHILSSRISSEDDEKQEEASFPPIIVYKGAVPPVEIYGSKSDIENASTNDKETHKFSSDKNVETLINSPDKLSEELSSQESLQFYSSEGAGYIDYMYSLLPDLIRDSFHRRLDGGVQKWLPVSPVEYAVAEDSYDRNETTTEKPFSPIQLETLTDTKFPQNSSLTFESTIKENIEELLSLLGKEETSDIVKK